MGAVFENFPGRLPDRRLVFAEKCVQPDGKFPLRLFFGGCNKKFRQRFFQFRLVTAFERLEFVERQ